MLTRNSPDNRGTRAVIVGARSLLGKDLRSHLALRKFPLRAMTIMGEGEEIGQIVEYGGEAHLITDLDIDHLRSVDLLFIAEPGKTAVRALEALHQGAGVAIDLVGADLPDEAPVVNMEVNAAKLPTRRPARVRSPHAISQVVSTALRRMAADSRIARLAVTALIPASESGVSGVDELYQQSAGALSFGERPEAVFGRQVAFNAVPHALLGRQGWPDLDRRLRQEVQELLGLHADMVSFHAVQVPVFHGTCLMVSVLLDPPVAPAKRRRRLSSPPFSWGVTTPAELGESCAIHVGDLEDEPGGGVTLWMVVDNVKVNGAENSVRIAEALFAAAIPGGGNGKK